MFAQAFSLRLAPHTVLGFMQQNMGLFGTGSARGAGKRDFSLPTFVRPGDQPEVLRFLLEFLFADLLGLYQMKYPCRGKHRASDSATLSLRLRQVWMDTSVPSWDAKGTLPARDAPGFWFNAGPAAAAWWEFGSESRAGQGPGEISFENCLLNQNTAGTTPRSR